MSVPVGQAFTQARHAMQSPASTPTRRSFSRTFGSPRFSSYATRMVSRSARTFCRRPYGHAIVHIWSRNQPKSKRIAPATNAITDRAPVHAAGSAATPRTSGPHPVKYAMKVDAIRSAAAVQIDHFAALMANFRPLHGARFSFRWFDGPPSRKASMGRKKNSSHTVCGQAYPHHIRPNVEPTKKTVTMMPKPNATRMRLSVGIERAAEDVGAAGRDVELERGMPAHRDRAAARRRARTGRTRSRAGSSRTAPCWMTGCMNFRFPSAERL